MKFVKNMIKMFRDDESGAMSIEYVALAAAVVLLGGVAATKVSTYVGAMAVSA